MKSLFTMSDEQLVTAYATGNNEAFDVLLNRHQQAVFGYILYTVRNRELADDIFQDTFTKAIVTIKQGGYTESGKFKAWVTRIAHNLIIDFYRKERYENTISNEEYNTDLFNNVHLSEDTIETNLVRTQVFNDVRKLVNCLPNLQREVLEMRYYSNMSFKEIAERTGVSINTALGRMRYAILNMRKMANDYGVSLSLN